MKRGFWVCLVILFLVAGDVFAQSTTRYRVDSFHINGQIQQHDVRFVDVTFDGAGFVHGRARFAGTNFDGSTWSFSLGMGVRVPNTAGTATSGNIHYSQVFFDNQHHPELVARVIFSPDVVIVRFFEGNFNQNSRLEYVTPVETLGLIRLR
jgi:hypothetical protein